MKLKELKKTFKAKENTEIHVLLSKTTFWEKSATFVSMRRITHFLIYKYIIISVLYLFLSFFLPVFFVSLFLTHYIYIYIYSEREN